MEAATPKINDSVIKEFMTTCKSEKDDSQRCRRIIGQLQAENEKLKEILNEGIELYNSDKEGTYGWDLLSKWFSKVDHILRGE